MSPLLHIIFADRLHGPTLFIIKGTSVGCRVKEKDNRWDPETLLDCCPEESILMSRENVAGMDTFCFTRWAEYFVDYCGKTRPGEDILIVHDGYWSHLGLKALKTLMD